MFPKRHKKNPQRSNINGTKNCAKIKIKREENLMVAAVGMVQAKIRYLWTSNYIHMSVSEQTIIVQCVRCVCVLALPACAFWEPPSQQMRHHIAALCFDILYKEYREFTISVRFCGDWKGVSALLYIFCAVTFRSAINFSQ